MKSIAFKICSLGLALSMAAGLAGCGNTATSTSGSSGASGSSAASGSDAETFNFSAGITPEGSWEGVVALDYVTLPQYKGLDLPADKIAVTDEAMDAAIQSILENFATKEQLTDRAVEKDDLVNIDYVGSVGGVEFTGGNTGGNGTTVTAGSANYIDDFLTQIIGMKPGESKDVVVTFPDDYDDSTDKDGKVLKLAGQEAVFVTTVNYIEGEEIFPEFTDAFVAENLKADYEWATVEQAKAEIKQDLEDSNKSSYMLETLNTNSTVSEVPQIIADLLIEQNLANLKMQAANYGMDTATFLTMVGYADEDAFKEGIKEDAAKASKQQLILLAIAETEKMTVTDDEIKEMFGQNYKQAIEFYGVGYLKMMMLTDKVGSLLITEN